MDNIDYYADRKYCPGCEEYVHYLMSVEHSYCVHCGQRVKLFSKEDWETFNENLARQKGRGGRRKRRAADSESA